MANNTTPFGATGGVSQIAYLQKQRDGVVFQETFENVNFLAADGWTVLRGSPANTEAQAVAGISSWDNTAGNQSMPIAQKVITDTNVDIPSLATPFGWVAQCWFYDPLTTSGGLYTTSAYKGPYFKIQDSLGQYFQVGVRNSISTPFYCCNPSTSFTADTFAVNNQWPRSAGWHLFQITALLGQYQIQLDYSKTQFTLTTSTGTLSSLFVCAGTSGDSGQSFGNFDQIGYYRGSLLKMGPSSLYNFSINMYDQNNNYLQPNQQNSHNKSYAQFYLASVNNAYASLVNPNQVYFEIPTTSGSVTSLGYRTPLMTVNPGDIYSLQTINFGRKVTTYDPYIKELQSVSMSTAGVRETNNYGLKSTISWAVNSLTGWSWKQANDNWYLNSVQGNPFSLMVDNVSDNAFGVIGTSSFGGETNTVSIMQSVLGTSAYTTSQFTVGNYYYLRNNANTQKQVVNLVSSTSTTLTFDQTLNWNVQPLDYVYSLQLYPFLEVTGDTQNGFKCTDPMIPRFTWAQNAVDYNNG